MESLNPRTLAVLKVIAARWLFGDAGAEVTQSVYGDVMALGEDPWVAVYAMPAGAKVESAERALHEMEEQRVPPSRVIVIAPNQLRLGALRKKLRDSPLNVALFLESELAYDAAAHESQPLNRVLTEDDVASLIRSSKIESLASIPVQPVGGILARQSGWAKGQVVHFKRQAIDGLGMVDTYRHVC